MSIPAWQAAEMVRCTGDLCKMRLPANFLANLQDARERRFDHEIAARSPAFAARDEQVRLDWVTDRRRWLARIGVTAQQHVLDHLEIMVAHGNRVIDDPVGPEDFYGHDRQPRTPPLPGSRSVCRMSRPPSERIVS